MLRALRAEMLKLKGARVVLWTALAAASFPLFTTFMIRLIDTTFSRARWESFMGDAPVTMASWWGLLVFGLATSYLFGREYTDGTAKNMLTLPVRRESFVAAKMVVLALWVFSLAALSVALQAGLAAVLRLPGFAWRHVWDAAGQSMEIAFLMYLTLPVVAWLAMLERGYLPPMLFSSLMAAVALMPMPGQWARWFPWSMPQALVGSFVGLGLPRPTLVAGSWVVAAGVFLVGTAAVVLYVDRADNAQ